MLESDLVEFIEQDHRAIDAFLKGDPEPVKKLLSHRDDVTLANPFGPPARGWKQVAQTAERAASGFREGAATGFERISEYATADLAYIVEIEREQAKLGAADEIASFSLRATTIFRREDGEWKIAHRHADAITSPRPPESLLGSPDASVS